MGAVESTELAVTEKPQQLITIEPAKYVALVFEPFAKRLADAKTLAKDVTFDVTTTAGMAVAVKHRATFRDIRVASEKARKERKAPILEIGKLLDSRQREIEAEIEPFEAKFDSAIKEEEQRKEVEKARKAAEESARITKIRLTIETLRRYPTDWLSRTSDEMDACATDLADTPISLDFYGEYTGEATQARDESVAKLREMAVATREREAESRRLAEERAAFEREQAAAAERERVAAAERAEQERIAQAERDRVAAVQREEQEQAAALLREQQAEHARQVAAQQAELDAQKAELLRQQAAIVAAQEAQAQAERDEQARRDAEEQALLDAIAAEARRVEEEMAARVQAEKDAAASAQLAEAARQQEEREAAEAERQRRERVQFELNGPDPVEILAALANKFDVEQQTVLNWLNRYVWSAVEIEA
jgi:hypothetical protein